MSLGWIQGKESILRPNRCPKNFTEATILRSQHGQLTPQSRMHAALETSETDGTISMQNNDPNPDPDPDANDTLSPGITTSGTRVRLGTAECNGHLFAPTIPSSGEAAAGDFVLSWDEWYARIARTVKEPLVHAVNEHGDPAGSNTIRVTVWPDLRIEVALEHPSNPEFDAAVLQSYRSLMFNPALEFPRGSKR